MADIIASRWTVRAGSSERGRGVVRHVASDGAQRVDVVRPAPDLGGARTADFLAGHRALQGKPAAMPILHVGGDGTVVRQRGTATLADLGRPLRGHEALALAGWLGPVVMLASPLLAGELYPEDVALDDEHVPRLAPRGAPQHPAQRERPLAPELRTGRPPDTRTALFGLGALLYELLVGEPPGEAAGPPSRKARNLSPEVDRVVMGLLSPEGPKRQYSLPPQPKRPPVMKAEGAKDPASAAPLRPVPSSSRDASSPYAPRGSMLELDEPNYAVLVDPRKLSKKASERLTEWLHLPEGTIEEFARVGLPLPVACVAELDDAEACRSFLDDLRVDGQTTKRGAAGAQWQTIVWLALLASTSGVAFLVAPRVVGVAALVIAALAVPVAFWWTGQQTRKLDTALELLRRHLEGAGEPSRTWSVQQSAQSQSAAKPKRAKRGRAQLRDAMRDAIRDRPPE